MDSFEPGRITRETINARAMSRDRHAGPSSAGRPNWCAIAATAATCPCGSDRMIVTASATGRSREPFRVASIASTASGGSIDRFATVSLRTAVPSR